MSLLKDLASNKTVRIIAVEMEMGNITGMETISATNSSVELFDLKDPGDARYFGVFVGFLVFILGTIGNGLTVWAYTRNRNLQTSFNVLIANLCLVELVFSVAVIPSVLPGYVLGYNLYSSGVCYTIGYFYYTSLASSLYNLVAIAVNRYVGIVQSEKYQRLFTGPRLTICIASVWIVPPILYLPVVIGDAIHWMDNTLRCSIGKGEDISSAIKWYNLGLNITFQAIPLIILIVLYTAIFRKVKQVQRKMKEHQRSTKRIKKISYDNTSSIVRNKSTSDDTDDEVKPSSLIEGINFKPVIISTDYENTPIPDTPQKTSDSSSRVNETTSPSDHITDQNGVTMKAIPSEDKEKVEQSPMNARKRNSIWKLLIKNNLKANSTDLLPFSSPISFSTDHPSSDDEMTSKYSTLSPGKDHKEVTMRENGIELRSLRRKKSLSVPTLPLLNLTDVDVAKSDNVQSLQHPFEKHHNVPFGQESSDYDQSDGEQRLSRVKSAYVKRTTRERTFSDVGSKQSKTSLSTRSKTWATTSVMYRGESDNDGNQGHRPHLGTIARKIQEKRRRAEKKNKTTRYRKKMMKKKQARERQLVYSSFTICMAFAACITPTSLLYLIQILFKIEVAASVLLIVSCIAWIHAVVNPLIYGYLNSQYRREYSRIFRYIKKRLFNSNVYTPKPRTSKC